MSTASRSLEELLDQARRLPEDERRLLLDNLQSSQPQVSPDRRRVMERWLSRAGSAHADASDISSHKNDYLTR